MTKNGSKILSLVLSVLLLALPFSDISFAGSTPASLAEHDHPCHQQSSDMSGDHCPESGASQCQCCDFAVTAVISYKAPVSSLVVLLTSIVQDRYLDSYISQSATPPFRPPRFFA